MEGRKIYTHEEIEEELKAYTKPIIYKFSCECGVDSILDISENFQCKCGRHFKKENFKIIE